MFEGEVVIVDPEKNMVRMLNQVGSRVWELIDGTRTTKEIVVQLVEEFDVKKEEAKNSVEGFIEDLANKGLLTWA
jgi:hypothetical protein